MKIAIVLPAFKTGNTAGISNYLPISALTCFTKILERVMYNCLYQYLSDQKILHPQQFSFRKVHSIEHVIAQLVDQIYKSFENDNYTVCNFVDLSKVFNTVDYTILLKKLQIYAITGANVVWFRGYLINRNQYICSNNDTKINEQKVTCRVPQRSILGPMLFSIYVHGLPSTSNFFNTMFANDTNILFEHKGISVPFSTVIRELQKINEWFIQISSL